MPKRKASFAFPEERPAKLVKRSTSSTVNLKTRPSVRRPAFTPVLLQPPSPTKTTEVAPTSPFADSDPVPSLRRASTLTLPSESPATSSDSSIGLSRRSSKSSTRSKTPPLTKKSSRGVGEGSLVTRLSGTKSGSVIGVTTATTAHDAEAEGVALSRKRSSVKAGPSGIKIPIGLTKLALPSSESANSLRLSESVLINNVEETELSSALASLTSVLSKGQVNAFDLSMNAPSTSRLDSKTPLHSKESETTLSRSSSRSSGVLKRLSTSSKASLTKLRTKTPMTKATSVEKIPKLTTKSVSTSVAPVNRKADLVSQPASIDVVLSFDVTKSMFPYFQEVRARMIELAIRLQGHIPGIRIAAIVHGDYCIGAPVIQWIDFISTVTSLCDFLNNVDPFPTVGGGGQKCYELALMRARTALSWSPNNKKMIIMISDGVPHEGMINWRDECLALSTQNIRVFAISAGEHEGGQQFSEEISRLTGGVHAHINGFYTLFDLIVMTCYREGNAAMFHSYPEEVMASRSRELSSTKRVTDAVAIESLSGKAANVAAGTSTTVKTARKVKAKELKTKIATQLKTMKIKKVVKATGKKQNSNKTAQAPKGSTKKVVKSTGKKHDSNKTAKTPRHSTKKVLEATRQKQDSNKTTKAPKGSTNKKVGKSKQVREFREKVINSSFHGGPLKKVTWSKWMTFVVKKTACTENKKGLTTTKSGNGMKMLTMFENDFREPAIYEVAVRSDINSKMYPLYYKSSLGFGRRSLHNYLLNRSDVNKEVEEAVQNTLKVSVRRGTSAAKTQKGKERIVKDVAKYLDNNYDYAWKIYPWRDKKSHRLVKIFRKSSNWVTVSHDDIGCCD